MAEEIIMIDITGRPEDNPLGTVRGSIGGGSWVLTGVFLPTPAPNMWVSVLTGEHVTHLMISLSGMPVIGAVPGTPAWELWKNYRADPDAGPHSYQEERDDNPDPIRLCGDARTDPVRCRRLRGHDGPCSPANTEAKR